MDWRKVYYYYLICKIIKKYQRTVRGRLPVKATSIQQPHTMAIFFTVASLSDKQTYCKMIQNQLMQEKQIVSYNLKREPIVYSPKTEHSKVMDLLILFSFLKHFYLAQTSMMCSEYATCTVHAVSNKGFLHLVISNFLLC